MQKEEKTGSIEISDGKESELSPTERQILETVPGTLVTEEDMLPRQRTLAMVPLTEKKDNRVLALVFMNFFALFGVAQGVLFKIVYKQGVQIFEYMFFRNVCVFLVAVAQLCHKRVNPFRGISGGVAGDIMIRVTAGQLTFGIVVYCMSIMPIGTAMIIFQINPFWVSVLACLLLKERIRPIEILGMLICFGGVIMIAFAKQERMEAKEEAAKEEAVESDADNTPMV